MSSVKRYQCSKFGLQFFCFIVTNICDVCKKHKLIIFCGISKLTLQIVWMFRLHSAISLTYLEISFQQNNNNAMTLTFPSNRTRMPCARMQLQRTQIFD